MIDPTSIKQIDLVCDDSDQVEVEAQVRPDEGGFVLYVHLNGATILRLGRVTNILGIMPQFPQSEEIEEEIEGYEDSLDRD